MLDYSLPSQTTFSRKVVPDLYEVKQHEIKSGLRAMFPDDEECYAIMAGAWTSKANDGYVCATCHVMNREIAKHVRGLHGNGQLAHCRKFGPTYAQRA